MPSSQIGFAIALVCVLNTTANATLVTYSYSGTITDVRDGGQSGTSIAGVGGIDVGDSFTGSFTYDTDNASGGPSLWFFNPTTTNTLSVDIDGQAFNTPIGSVSGAQLFNDSAPTTDIFNIVKGGPSLPPGWSAGSGSQMNVVFFDFAGLALSDTNLPLSFQSGDWDAGLFVLQFLNDVTTPTGDFNNIYIEGTIDLSAAAVPEPSSLLLCSAAAGLCRLTLRRRQCSPQPTETSQSAA